MLARYAEDCMVGPGFQSRPSKDSAWVLSPQSQQVTKVIAAFVFYIIKVSY